MLHIIIPVLLVLVGLGLILKFKPSPDPNKEKDEKKDDTANSPAKVVKRSVPLEDLVKPVNFPDEVAFYFGSQTGTAEKFCNILQEEASTVGVTNPRVIDFEDFKPEVFCKHQLVIVCVATHYEGDPCDNTKKFYKWVRENVKQKENSCMKGVKFSVFGLGDTSYEQYNYIGKYFNDNFAAFGGEMIYKYGEGNAEGNHTEDDFNEWKADIWQQLFEYYEKKETAIEREESKKQHDKIVKVPSKKGDNFPLFVRFIQEKDVIPEELKSVNYELTSKQFLKAKEVPIEEIKQLRQNLDEGSTLEITYDLTETGLSYKTASNLAIFPDNDIDDVKKCSEILGLDLDSKFIFETNPNSQKKGPQKHPFPTPITVREALLNFVDLVGPLRKKTIKDISSHCSDEVEKQRQILQLKFDRLIQLTENKEEFHKEIELKQVGLLTLLQQYKSINLTPDAFFQISQRIMPRYYTIASSNVKNSQKVKIAISLTFDKLFNGETKMGLTSKYCQKIFEKGTDFKTQKITNKVFINDSLFTQPLTDEAPMIMVGPGTGVVPFIGFMQEREVRLQKDPSINFGDAYLFFGCRKSTSDFIYKEEIEGFEKSNLVKQVYYAFSREKPNVKVYVQDYLRKEKELILDCILNKKGYFYICGNTKMGQDVQHILKEFLGENNYKELEKEKRLIKELWG